MKPVGFWSYARGDDDHLDEMLTRLRKQIAGEVSMVLGEDVGIFQDIHDIRVGDDWADKLRGMVHQAAFLIPVLSPRFFNREWCCEEVLTYLKIAKDAGLAPRIFPIKFVDWDRDDDCAVRDALAPYQWADFSHYRFESDPTQRALMLNKFAKDVKERLKLPKPATKTPAKPAPKATRKQAAKTDQNEVSSTKADIAESVPPPEPTPIKTHVVDTFPGRGGFQTITAAIEAAAAGDRIVVREGTYRESVTLSKPLELLGEGDRERIVVHADAGNALYCDASVARISGMSFRRGPGGVKNYGGAITGGAAEVEDCIFESESLAGISISGTQTKPTFRRCLARNCSNAAGYYVRSGATPILEDCQTDSTVGTGYAVKGQGTAPTFRRCIANGARQGNFFFYEEAQGLLVACEAVEAGLAGIEVIEGANPTVRDCIFRDGKGSGIYVHSKGQGAFFGNQSRNNQKAGVNIREGGAPHLERCTITGNKYQAVWITDLESAGVFRDNDLRGNTRGAWKIADGVEITSERNKE